MSYFLSDLPRPSSRLLQGNQRSRYEPNDARDHPIKRTTATIMTAASDNATTGNFTAVTGGENWTQIPFQVRAGGATSAANIIPLNTLCHSLYGTTSGDNTIPVGFNLDADPDLLSKFSGYDYMRVRSVDLIVRCADSGTVNHPVEFCLLPYRSDIGVPGGLQPGSTTQRTNMHLVPGCIMWKVMNTGMQTAYRLKDGYKTFHFDIPKCFNDVEWMYDNLASTASTTNFWVAKGSGNKLWTTEPNMKLYGILYARVPRHRDGSLNIDITVQLKWNLEFTRSQSTLLPDNEE